MRIVALIDEAAVIERIPRHLGLWDLGVRSVPEETRPRLIPRNPSSNPGSTTHSPTTIPNRS